MDTTGLPFAKHRPAKLEKQARKVIRESLDKAENQKVKARSGGRCECVVEITGRLAAGKYRCQRRGNQTHHMIGGWGKRARGISALAERKQWVCQQCHDDIGGHVLQRIGGEPPQWDDVYRRVR